MAKTIKKARRNKPASSLMLQQNKFKEGLNQAVQREPTLSSKWAGGKEAGGKQGDQNDSETAEP